MGKLLITGSAGYIGSICVAQALAQGYEVVEFDIASDQSSSITNIDKLVESLDGVNAVFHFAALASVPESFASPLDYYDTNTYGTQVLLEAMLESGIRRLIFSSTAAVYPWHDEPLSESVIPSPASPYGASKLAAERMILDAASAHGIEPTIFRYFNVAGAMLDGSLGELRQHETHLIPCLFKAALTDAPAKIFGNDYPTRDGTCIRDFIHVLDVVGAHFAVLKNDKSIGEIFNIGSGSGYSILNVVEECQKHVDLTVEYHAPRQGDPPYLVANCDKIEQMIGWRPEYGLPIIVESAWKWCKHAFSV